MKVAVVGAAGLVGRTMLRVLEKRDFPVSEIALYGQRTGDSLIFRGSELKTIRLTPSSVKAFDLALFSAGSDVSLKYAPQFAKKGALVVDNSSVWRQHPRVPLVVPEVNPEALRDVPVGIVANPNCSTIQMVVALKPLVRFGIKEVFVSTYQAVSGAGKIGIDALLAEEKGTRLQDSPHLGIIHRNVLPGIGKSEEGFYEEETKLIRETKKIMGLAIPVHPTAVRVPVITGHSEAVAVRLRKSVSLEEIRSAMAKQEGLVLSDGFITPKEAEGRDEVFVSRLRFSPDDPKVILMWVVSDNLLKGAALNAVQIAERALLR
ncbi:MAG: aspartate-semialdehyde dehydrogenase [candidate division WOR-3 bacterium]